MSALAPADLFGVPVWMALCVVAVLVAMLSLVAIVAWCVIRRVDLADLPAALLGLAHVISALCGFLPWGKPTPPPALPQTQEGGPDQEKPTVVLIQGEADGAKPLAQQEGP
ncbi:hypothetical protein [Streptomyces sp. R21]|uniref:hypothetical protein n=1 Tax=Streptomyces sp. R21 TaxID=3238627 RepID=UPI0034E04394